MIMHPELLLLYAVCSTPTMENYPSCCVFNLFTDETPISVQVAHEMKFRTNSFDFTCRYLADKIYTLPS